MKQIAKKIMFPLLVAGASYGLFGQEKQQTYSGMKPVTVDSIAHKKILDKYNFDHAYFTLDIAKRDLEAAGKEVTVDNLADYYKKKHEYGEKNGETYLKNITVTGVNKLPGGKLQVTDLKQTETTYTITMDEARQDVKNFTLGDLNALDGRIPTVYEDCPDCDEPKVPEVQEEKEATNTSNWLGGSRFEIFGGGFFPLDTDSRSNLVDSSSSENEIGGMLGVSYRASNVFSFGLGLGYQSANSVEVSKEEVDESFLSESSRLFEKGRNLTTRNDVAPFGLVAKINATINPKANTKWRVGAIGMYQQQTNTITTKPFERVSINGVVEGYAVNQENADADPVTSGLFTYGPSIGFVTNDRFGLEVYALFNDQFTEVGNELVKQAKTLVGASVIIPIGNK